MFCMERDRERVGVIAEGGGGWVVVVGLEMFFMFTDPGR